MDYTKLPRELIYKDRKDLKKFGTDKEGTLNHQLYNLLRLNLINNLVSDNSDRLILWLFNESYYLTTMILLDQEADKNVDAYFNCIYLDSLYTTDETHFYKRIICAMIYVFLSRHSEKSMTISNVCSILGNEAEEYISFSHDLYIYTKPEADEFKPVLLTKTILRQLDLKKITSDYDLERIKELINGLGSGRNEKRLLTEAIFKSYYFSGHMSYIPYSVDNYLIAKYEEFGGKKEELKREDKKISKKDEQIRKLEIENANLLAQMNDLKMKNIELEQKVNMLASQLDKHAKERELMSMSEFEHQKREEMLKEQLEEMTSMVKKFKDKLGSKSVPLKVIADGIIQKANTMGLNDACVLFEQINLLLYDVSAWRNNKSELDEFFAEERRRINKGIHIDGGTQTIIQTVSNFKPQIHSQTNNMTMPPIGQQEQKMIEE